MLRKRDTIAQPPQDKVETNSMAILEERSVIRLQPSMLQVLQVVWRVDVGEDPSRHALCVEFSFRNVFDRNLREQIRDLQSSISQILVSDWQAGRGVNAAERFYSSVIKSHDHRVRAGEPQEHEPQKLRRHKRHVTGDNRTVVRGRMLQGSVDAGKRAQRFSVVGSYRKAEASIASRFSDDANVSCDTLANADRASNQRLIVVGKEGLVCSHAPASATSQNKGSDWFAFHFVQKGRLIPTCSFVERYP